MSFDRRTFVRASAFAGLGAAGALASASNAQAHTIKQGAKQEQQQRRTTGLGNREQEFYLAKITVSNLVRSYQFYTEIIGLRLATPLLAAPTDADPEQDFRELPLNFTATLGDPLFVLVKRRGITPAREHAALTTIGIKVADARAVFARAAQAGYETGRAPGEGAMIFAHLSDPDGYAVELIQAPPFGG